MGSSLWLIVYANECPRRGWQWWLNGTQRAMVNYANGLNEQNTHTHNRKGRPTPTSGPGGDEWSIVYLPFSIGPKRKWWFFQPLSRVFACLLSRFARYAVVVSYPNTSPFCHWIICRKAKTKGRPPLNGTRCGCNEWGFKWGFTWVNDIKLSSINYKTIWWLWELVLWLFVLCLPLPLSVLCCGNTVRI